RLTAGSCWGIGYSSLLLPLPASAGKGRGEGRPLALVVLAGPHPSPLPILKEECGEGTRQSAWARSGYLLELVQGAQRPGHLGFGEARGPVGVGDLADIDVTL